MPPWYTIQELVSSSPRSRLAEFLCRISHSGLKLHKYLVSRRWENDSYLNWLVKPTFKTVEMRWSANGFNVLTAFAIHLRGQSCFDVDVIIELLWAVSGPTLTFLFGLLSFLTSCNWLAMDVFGIEILFVDERNSVSKPALYRLWMGRGGECCQH